jgi:hypothetical protein
MNEARTAQREGKQHMREKKECVKLYIRWGHHLLYGPHS